jgi:hypothetical protein
VTTSRRPRTGPSRHRMCTTAAVRRGSRRRPPVRHHQRRRAGPRPAPAHTRRVASLAQSLLMRSRRAEVDRPIPANQRPSTCPPILALNARDSAGPPNRGKQKPRGRRGAARPSSDARPLPSTNAHARTYVDVVTSEQTVLDLSS